MLPPFIIEQIRKREEELRRRNAQQQPTLELPIEQGPPPQREKSPEEVPQRGVIILELLINPHDFFLVSAQGAH